MKGLKNNVGHQSSKIQKMDDAHHTMDKLLQVFIPHAYLLDKVFGYGMKWDVRTWAIHSASYGETEEMIRLSPEKSDRISLLCK